MMSNTELSEIRERLLRLVPLLMGNLQRSWKDAECSTSGPIISPTELKLTKEYRLNGDQMLYSCSILLPSSQLLPTIGLCPSSLVAGQQETMISEPSIGMLKALSKMLFRSSHQSHSEPT